MAYPRIANINVSLETTAVSVAGFGTPLFITAHKNWSERVREYSSLDEVLDDFSISDAAYRAAVSYFAPTPKPSTLKIGRAEASALFSLSEVSENVEYVINIGVNENGTSPIAYTAAGADDEEAVVDALILAIDALYSDELTVTKVGTGSTTQMDIVVVTGNTFVLGDLTNLSVALTATETSVEAKNACEDVDNDFYWVTTEFKDESNILDLAANTEATVRHYVSSLSSVDNLVAIGSPPSDTYGKLDDLGYERSSGIYHQDAENYPELGMIARFAIYEPGTMDYYAKTLPGFGVARNSDTGAILTSSEQAALVSRNVNSIVNEGGQAVFKMGYSFSGNQLLEIVFRDFYAARLTEAFQNWRINKKRIPYNQKGIDSAESVFLGVTERYKSTDVRPHAIDDFITRFPRREDVGFSDIASSTLNAEADVYLAGSIFTVNMNVSLTYNANF